MQNKHKKQKGYAAVLTLVLFSALSLSLFAVFNSGQIVTHKLKLQNAVDSATYSAVNVVARELNHMAYTNRAMVANQMIVGQLIGIISWNKQMVKMGDILESRAGKIRNVPIVGPPIYSTAKVIQGVTTFMGNLLDFADLPTAVKSQVAVIQALSQSQEYVHEATGVIFARTFPDVLKANNDSKNDINSATIVPLASLTLDLVVDNYDRLEKVDPKKLPKGNSAYASSSNANKKDNQTLLDYKRLENMVINSDDGFVGTKYDHGRSNYWGFGIYKKGGNEFELKQKNGKYNWEWSAMDTLTFYIDLWFFDFTSHLGWGAAHVAEDKKYDYRKRLKESNNKRGMWGGAFSSPTYGAAKKAAKDYGDNQIAKQVELISFYKYKNTTSQEVIGPEFVAAVSKNQDGVRTRNATVKDYTGNDVPDDSSINIEAKGNLSKKQNNIYAIAKAQVYFARSYEKIVVERAKNLEKKPPAPSAAKMQQDAITAGKERIKTSGGNPYTERRLELNHTGNGRGRYVLHEKYVAHDDNGSVFYTDSPDKAAYQETKHTTVENCLMIDEWTPAVDKRKRWEEIQKRYEYESSDGTIHKGTIPEEVRQQYEPTAEDNKTVNTPVCEKIDGFLIARNDHIERIKNNYRNDVQDWEINRRDLSGEYAFSRKDQKIEYANLFNPYWQVRLTDYKKTELNKALWILKAGTFINVDAKKAKQPPKL